MSSIAKSYFISAYTTLLAGASFYSVFMVSQSDWKGFWGGVTLTLLPAFLFFLRLFLAPIARTSQKLNSLVFCAAAGTVWSLLTAKPGQIIDLAFFNLGLGIGGLLLYVYWYSSFGRAKSKALVTGQQPPNFSLKRLDDSVWNSIELSNYPAILLFFRGNWCPLCMTQIREVAQAYRELESLGVNVCLVSPQPEDNTRTLASKFDVNFEFLSDPNNQAAKILGINADNGTPKGLEILGYDSDTVLPTAIAFDKTGNVLWSDQTDNYRVRPEPDTFIKVFNQNGLVQRQ